MGVRFDESSIGVWPNVAIPAGSDPEEVMRRYGARCKVEQDGDDAEHLKRVVRIQAESFLALERENKELRRALEAAAPWMDDVYECEGGEITAIIAAGVRFVRDSPQLAIEHERVVARVLEVAEEMRHIGASSMTPHELFCVWARDLEKAVGR